ncbi:putative FAD-dependent oxidoreductase domain-containing protein 1 [Apostichopus japonicus]|uniref:FAD-dependent oxidoreductase domain-containing protein 1 n=1 Tax=Stichopus japonicus TaxID=307972 RepID=A0A2G8JI32_STIJA|nr:putative FAD-dependent oxidoreductase domain-containing protein 1 [Apostichopus japonicus]
MTQNQLKKRFPWMNTDNVTLGSYGLENEGWLDPWSLLKSFKEKAIDLGAKYYNAEVTGFNVVDDDANPIDPTQFAPNGRRLNSVMVSMINSPEVVEVKSSYVVLTAGAWSGQLGKLLGIGTGPKEENLHMPIPVEPHPSGSYVRREGFGGNYLCGKSPNECDEPSCEDLNVNYDFFDTEIWPNLAHRIPVMEKLKVKSAWAGYYDYNCLDQNAIIGSHPAYGNFLMATGFSGHGIQQSPAVGKLVSEKILAGEFQTIDVSKFGFERCITETPVLERCVI